MILEARSIVKATRKIFLILCVLAMILASSVCANAIGFDTETVYVSVFVVYCGNSLGSGFAIGEDCIITNAHVVSDGGRVKIETYSGETKNAFVVSMDETLDIAVIGVPDASFMPLKVADLDEIGVGDDVYAIGAPNSLAFTLTKGVVSSKERYVGGQKYVQTDAAINTGNSGGPLLNDAGEVIGVNSYKMSDAEGLGLAIPIDVVVNYLETGDIALDADGNVAQSVTEDAQPEPTAEAPATAPSSPPKRSSGTVVGLAVLLALSAALNITLLMLLSREKKQNRYAAIPPSERTDFEIEIIE